MHDIDKPITLEDLTNPDKSNAQTMFWTIKFLGKEKTKKIR